MALEDKAMAQWRVMIVLNMVTIVSGPTYKSHITTNLLWKKIDLQMFTHDFEAGEIQSMAREDRGNSIYSLPLNGITDNGKGEGRGLSNSFFSNNHTSDSEGKKKKKIWKWSRGIWIFPPSLPLYPFALLRTPLTLTLARSSSYKLWLGNPLQKP